MSKKDYILFAKMIAERKAHIENITSENMSSNNVDYDKQIALDAQFYELRYYALQISDIFQQDNPNFDRICFLQACGIEQ